GTGDPVAGGLAESLARPGRNFTGFTIWEYSVFGKMLEILKQAAPHTETAAVIYNPDNPATATISQAFEQYAGPLAIRPVLCPIHTRAEIENAIASMAKESNGALFFPPDVTVNAQRVPILQLVSQHRLPAIYSDPLLTSSGGLMSYGPDRVDIFRRSASY